MVSAAVEALKKGCNQYSVTWGAPSLRRSVASHFGRWYGMEIDLEREITICCGWTEAMISTVMALINPGDGLIFFEPFYENYGPDAVLCGAAPRAVPLLQTGNGFEVD